MNDVLTRSFRYSFKDDYSELGHEKVLSDLLKISNKQFDTYGLDSISDEAKELIKKRFALSNADIHFISGGTQTNAVLINAALSPIEAVIAAQSGHICLHECGAIEHSGNKIISVTSDNGKILPSNIEAIIALHTDEHMVKPKLVYISQPTENGTVYLKQELISLFETCKKNNLYLYIDGARLGAALVSRGMDIKPEDMENLCDAFYIGGTKNGSPLGEALCVINEKLKENFRYYLKQHGAMPAKGMLTGSCFKTLFEDDLFFCLAKRANKTAQKIASALCAKGYKMRYDAPANQVFPILPNTKIAELQKYFKFHVWEKLNNDTSVIRLVCCWAADEEEADRLISMV